MRRIDWKVDIYGVEYEVISHYDLNFPKMNEHRIFSRILSVGLSNYLDVSVYLFEKDLDLIKRDISDSFKRDMRERNYAGANDRYLREIKVAKRKQKLQKITKRLNGKVR